jgi:hypothetical protein
VRPLNSASAPSSAAIVFIVPMNPWYLGTYPGAVFWIWSLTFAVSIGMVQHSAIMAALDAIKTFLKKKAVLDSPGLCLVFIKTN